MKAYQPIRFWGAVAIATFGLINSLQAHFSLHTIDTMAITDMKAAGRSFQVPTAERPIYYEAVNVGMDWHLGRMDYAGDLRPDIKLMQDAIVRALARNHYLSADASHPAAQLIVMAWGTLRSDTADLTGASYRRAVRILAGDKYMDFGDMSEEGPFSSMGAIVPHRTIAALSQAKLHNFAEGDCYYAEIRGYSAADAKRNRATELWQTRIACPSAGLVMSKTFPTMIQLAAPHIGIETKKAIFTTPAKNLREDIQTGEIKVLDDVDVNAARVIPLKSLMKPNRAEINKSFDPKPTKVSK
jgi:hypothetical protein